MHDQLHKAFDDLAGSVQPPVDAADRVSTRRSERRRNRQRGCAAVGAGAVAVVLLGVFVLGGPQEKETGPARGPASSASQTPDRETPGPVSCSEPDRILTAAPAPERNWPGLTAMLRDIGRTAAYWLDRDRGAVFGLRSDGSTHTVWHVREDAEQWVLTETESCMDEAGDWRDVPQSVTGPAEHVVLEVGHCWIEPVDVFGGSWEPLADDQHGYGTDWRGEKPFVGEGTAWRAGDVVSYLDESGEWFTLIPEGAPGSHPRDFCL